MRIILILCLIRRLHLHWNRSNVTVGYIISKQLVLWILETLQEMSLGNLYRIYAFIECLDLNRLQSLQSNIRKITDAPFYISNLTLHTDLHVPFLKDLAWTKYINFNRKLINHPNPFVHQLSSHTIPGNPPWRFRREWPGDLLLWNPS